MSFRKDDKIKVSAQVTLIHIRHQSDYETDFHLGLQNSIKIITLGLIYGGISKGWQRTANVTERYLLSFSREGAYHAIQGHRRYIRFELGARNCFDRDSPERQNKIGERSAWFSHLLNA